MNRGRYPYEFRKKVVDAVKEGKPVAEVALAFEVCAASVHNWIREFNKGGKKEKDPIQRRRQFSEEVKRKALELLEAGMPVVEVAEQCGATTRSVYDWHDAAYPERRRAKRVAGKEEVLRAEERLNQAEIDREKARVEAEQAEAERVRLENEEKERVKKLMADPLTWLRTGTKTKDSHWREHGADSPYRPFPDWPYFQVVYDDFRKASPYCVEKSRDLMISWLMVGIFTHAAMTVEGIEVLFQSQKQEKADELIEYAKILYEQSDEAIRKVYPLAKSVQSSSEIAFANGSRIIAIPGGGDQIRSYHPWALLMDEAAFMPEGSEAFDNALSVCKKVVAISSAGPGWFADYVNDCEEPAVSGPIKGLSARKTRKGTLVRRVHYSAHPERGPEWVAKARQGYTSQAIWDREQEIIHEAGGGERIFAEVFARWQDKILIDLADGFQASPYWKRISGFDHGKANPTAALVACIDQDGVIYITGEYYMPGLSPKQHRPNLEELEWFLASEAIADPSIFHKSMAQSDGTFKAIADLYVEEGIRNMLPAPNTNELTGMERILNHWSDLDKREPTLKIVCPRGLREITKPIYGIHNFGCPNLLWELRRARREELSAGQLVHKNPSERIVDKDNHLRDCLKYIVSALLEPSRQTPEQKALAAIKDIPLSDPTSRVIRYQDAYIAAKQSDDGPMIPMGMRGRYNLMRYREWERLRNKKGWQKLPWE